ncbi:MAG: CAP domain-containing protein [Ilumatobacter sp.]
MKHFAAIVVALAVSIPVGAVAAAPEAISEPFIALRGAERVGNATPMTQPDVVPQTPATPTVTNVTVEMQAILDLVNVERMSRGLVPVRFSAKLNDAALVHTLNQAADGDIYHVDPDDGSSPGDRITRTGYRFSTWGENVAAGYRTPQDVMVGWMESPGHCRNILNPGFTELGVGYVSGGQVYNHFWTQEFGRPNTEPRPAGVYNPAWC